MATVTHLRSCIGYWMREYRPHDRTVYKLKKMRFKYPVRALGGHVGYTDSTNLVMARGISPPPDGHHHTRSLPSTFCAQLSFASLAYLTTACVCFCVCSSLPPLSQTRLLFLTPAEEESSEKLTGVPIFAVGPDETSSFKRMISLQRRTTHQGMATRYG